MYDFAGGNVDRPPVSAMSPGEKVLFDRLRGLVKEMEAQIGHPTLPNDPVIATTKVSLFNFIS